MRTTRFGALAFLVALHLAAGARAEDLECLMQPLEIVTVSAPVEGVLEQVAVDRGDVVEKGSVLAVLESNVERAAVSIARARAAQDFGVRSNKVRAELGARRFQRADELFKKQMVAFKDFDEAGAAKALAEYELGEARDQKRLADLDLERAQAILDQRTVRSPIGGVVMERLRHPGELAASEHPIVKLARLDPLRVEVFAPIALYGRVAPGQRVTVVPDAPLDRPLEATVTVVDKVADAASGTFGVRLSVPNPGNRVPAGLKCKVRIGESG